VRPAYGFAAAGLALAGFAAIEAAGARAGVWTALTPSALLDAIVYVLTGLLVALLFAPLFRRAPGWRAPFAILGYVLLFAPLAGALAGAIELSLTGTWGVPTMVTSAFLYTPLNLIYTYVLDLPIVALPMGVASAALLWWLARGAGRVRRSSPATV
jgi:hypothetical protein